MARNRSRSRQPKRSTFFSRLVGLIWFVVVGGGIAGWAAPDLPVVGPLVQQIIRNAPWKQTAGSSADGFADDRVANLEIAAADGSHGTAVSNSPIGAILPGSTTAPTTRKPAETITVASFNIQVFGESKLSKTWVVEILAQNGEPVEFGQPLIIIRVD